MSLDFLLAHQCPHMTVEEVVALGTDRRTLSTLQPVAAESVVRIVANDEVYIPQSGLYSNAQLYSGVSGPFDLNVGQNVLTITTSVGTQTVTFPVTSRTRLTTAQVIQEMQRQGFNVAVVENINGLLLFTDTGRVGQESVVKVSGTAAVQFGFGNPRCLIAENRSKQYSARGKLIYPGWQLLKRPDTLTNKYPIFNARVQGNPVFKVTYATLASRCRRCGATYIENDFRFDPSGQGLLIGNEDLLYQAALKILLTDRGSNPYHLWYGTTIRSRIGAKAVGSITAGIAEEVRMALSHFQKVQQEQGKFQQVTLKERMYQVLGAQVLPHQQDPTTFLINVAVQNAASEPIALSVVFTVPGVVAVMGSNGLTLGLEPTGLSPRESAHLLR